MERAIWWKFNMPDIPDVLVSQTFKASFPKTYRNSISARSVGGVCGVYNLTELQVDDVVSKFGAMDIRDRVVSYANDLRKIEINQLNWILQDRFAEEG
jgi:hypothetical protein